MSTPPGWGFANLILTLAAWYILARNWLLKNGAYTLRLADFPLEIVDIQVVQAVLEWLMQPSADSPERRRKNRSPG